MPSVWNRIKGMKQIEAGARAQLGELHAHHLPRSTEQARDESRSCPSDDERERQSF